MDPTLMQLILDELGWDEDPEDVEAIRERAEEDPETFEEVVRAHLDASSFTIVDEQDLAAEDHWNVFRIPLGRLAGKSNACKMRLLKVAFRSMARVYHADKGGDDRSMRVLLEARTALESIYNG